MATTKFQSLEAALYQRELNALTAKLVPLVTQIREVFSDLCGEGQRMDTDGVAEVKEINTWVRSLPELGAAYYSGYYVSVDNPNLMRIPAPLEKVIKERAVANHMAAVDSLDEIRQVAEAAYHAANS